MKPADEPFDEGLAEMARDHLDAQRATSGRRPKVEDRAGDGLASRFSPGDYAFDEGQLSDLSDEELSGRGMAHPDLEYNPSISNGQDIHQDKAFGRTVGKLIRACLERGLVDELELYIIPRLLGAGIPLFEPREAVVSKLALAETRSWPNGVMKLRYGGSVTASSRGR